MTSEHRPFAAVALLVFAACSASPVLSPELLPLLREAPEDMPARFVFDADGLRAAAVAIGPGMLPPPVRTAAEAVVPRGELVFQGRERGPRGDGFRIEKRYVDGALEHVRSALIATDGSVLERWHTVPLGDVPQDVLAAALHEGPEVLHAAIVSGPEREEHWLCTVKSRIGHTFVVKVGLDGTALGVLRRVSARADV